MLTAELRATMDNSIISDRQQTSWWWCWWWLTGAETITRSRSQTLQIVADIRVSVWAQPGRTSNKQLY